VRYLTLAAVGLVALLAGTGCVANDTLFDFNVTNNMGFAVIIRQCGNASCTNTSPPYSSPITLKNGQSYPDAGDPDGVLRAEKVFSLSGKTLGCLPFRFSDTPPATFAVRISQMVPCDRSGGSSAVGGHDWPSRRY
jgi:hypothetical protein